MANIKFNSEEIVFRSVVSTPSGEFLKPQPLSYTRFRELFLALIGSIGLDPSEYGTHSLRSGGASSAATHGITHEQIKSHGRWKTDSAKERYIEKDSKARMLVSSSLGL